MASSSDRLKRVFVYGLEMSGEREHELLADAEFVGNFQTAEGYRLVDLDVYPAMILSRMGTVVGELYSMDVSLRSRLDIHKEHPVHFERQEIRLADGSVAESYLMDEAKLRGRRRLAQGDWRQRFAPKTRPQRGALAEWARKRHG